MFVEASGAVVVGLIVASLVLTCFLAACAAIICQKIKLQRQSKQLQKISESRLPSQISQCHYCAPASICDKNGSQYNSQNFFYLPSSIHSTKQQDWSPKRNTNLKAKQNSGRTDTDANVTSHQCCCNRTQHKLPSKSKLQNASKRRRPGKLKSNYNSAASI